MSNFGHRVKRFRVSGLPAQIQSFGRRRGALAKTDRTDAELIARFMAFRSEDGRRLQRETLRGPRALAAKRNALHSTANQKTVTACEVEDIDAGLREVPGIGLVACAMPVAERPELGQIRIGHGQCAGR